MNIPLLIRMLSEKGLSPTDIAEIVELIQMPSTKPQKAPRGSKQKFVPETWHPTESHYEKARELGMPDDDFTLALASFREWEFKDPKSNFDLAFHRWLRNQPRGKPPAINFAEQRASSRVQAMVEGARIASATGRRRWTF